MYIPFARHAGAKNDELSLQESSDDREVLLALLEVRDVRRLRELHPGDVLEVVEVGLDDAVLRLVVVAVDQQRRAVDQMDAVDDRPVLDDARDEELIRPVPARGMSDVQPESPPQRTHMVM